MSLAGAPPPLFEGASRHHLHRRPDRRAERLGAPCCPRQIADEVLADLEPGVVVALHDGIPPAGVGMPGRATPAATVAAVAAILDEAAGLRLVTITQLRASDQ